MSYRREHRASRASLFDGYDGLEEGGLKASSSYSHEVNEHDNDKALDSLKERVVFLKRLTGDVHEEVESHNRLLDRMGNSMDASRGIMSGTMDRFKMVFEKKSNRRICTLVASFVVAFLVIYYLIRQVIQSWGSHAWLKQKYKKLGC
ncbi:hypothetical protein Pint_24629 [Pistacia integerrima]|uniref:Uncharacterized protein n=1 Tax=Pistacia integerrima TaxID=434235 RepID=A0ACC0YDM4_9ROSI|nr:hypothetical protein Pint_24629 [Pistacia integerrima]